MTHSDPVAGGGVDGVGVGVGVAAAEVVWPGVGDRGTDLFGEGCGDLTVLGEEFPVGATFGLTETFGEPGVTDGLCVGDGTGVAVAEGLEPVRAVHAVRRICARPCPSAAGWPAAGVLAAAVAEQALVT